MVVWLRIRPKAHFILFNDNIADVNNLKSGYTTANFDYMGAEIAIHYVIYLSFVYALAGGIRRDLMPPTRIGMINFQYTLSWNTSQG